MIIFWFILSIVLLILLITKCKLHAFLSLLVVAVFMGFAAGLSPADITTAIGEGFGGTMKSIGIVIVCGVVIGEVLEITGGAQKIADAVLRVVGKKRATLATGITGGIVSIPVFCDSGFILLTPVIRALSRLAKVPYMSLVIALMAGLLTTHSFVPPTPGPIAAAGILGADIGKVMLYGLIVSVPVIFVSCLWANSKYIRTKYPDIAVESAEDLKKNEQFKEVVAKAPTTFMSFMPIVVPIILIVAASFTKQYMNQELVAAQIIGFIGTPFISLIIGTGFAFLLPTKINGTVTETWVTKAMEKSAEVLLITAAGGSFGKLLQTTSVGDVIGNFVTGVGMPAILIPFVISCLILIAQGGATVALMTTSAIIAPMLTTMGLSPELAVMAIAAGSMTGVQSNGSYFWCVTKMSNFNIKQGYVAVTLSTVIMGVTALISVVIFSLFVK